MNKAGAIGIDVGGTKTLFALLDNSFQLIEDLKIGTEIASQQEFVNTLQESVGILLDKAAKTHLNVATIGVGCAGRIDTQKGIVKTSPNIPALERFSFKEALSKLTNAKVKVFNDINAGLYGEHKLGAAAGYKHVIGIFVGTGVGGAIIINGKLYTGASGDAGDIGHYMLQPLGPLGGSENGGVLDTIASRSAIAGEAATLAAKGKAPYLLESVGTDVVEIKSSSLADAIREGDKHVEELVRNRAHILGIVLSNIVDFLNPEMIVLGGGLVDAMPEIIQQEVAAGIQSHATAEASQGLRIVIAKLKAHAIAIGAAKLASDLLRN